MIRLDVRRVLRQVFPGLPNTSVARQVRLQLFVDTAVSRYAESLDLPGVHVVPAEGSVSFFPSFRFVVRQGVGDCVALQPLAQSLPLVI